MKSNILEIELATPNGNDVYFNPAGKKLRGAWDYLRMSLNDHAYSRPAIEYPRGVPGKRIRVRLDDSHVTIVEPLANPEWAEERSKIEARGFSIERDEEISNAYLPDWLHEIKRTLDCKCAKLVQGKLPDDLGEERLVEELGGSQSSDKEWKHGVEKSLVALQDAVALVLKSQASK